MEQLCVLTSEEDIGKRVDLFLAEELESASRSRIQKLISGENVFVGGKPVKQNYRVRKNDFILVNIIEPETPDILPEDIPLEVLYEDGELIVVNKPKGMVVHPAAGHYSGTLVNALMYRCGDSLSGINGIARPGIVHRIDRQTSGILVAAKTDTAHAALSLQLMDHSMKRVYSAITRGVIKKDALTVDKPIARSKTDRKKMAVDSGGKRAVTHVTVLERFKRNTFIEARLETGRTHQIRVHLAHEGFPLLGDEVYGPAKQPSGLDGQALHAGTLGFVHPSGEYMEFHAGLPLYFAKTLERLR